MPIEDVDYLKKNSIKQSYLFLVDSADRNKLSYPTPAEYVIDFTTPFHNVVGFEVINASIPRTMYNIDVINNTIVFAIHEGTPKLDLTTTVRIPPGEYTIQTLVVALNQILCMHVNRDPSKPLVYITAESTTNPPDIESKIRFRCPYPFFIDMATSACAETLGFDEYTQPSEALVPLLERRYEAPFYPSQQRVFHSVDIPPQVAYGKERTVFQGPRGVLRRAPINTTNFVAQRFVLTSKAYLKQIFAGLYADVLSTNDVVHWEIRRTNQSDTAPRIDGTAPVATGTIAISFTDGTLSDSELMGSHSILLEADTPYWIIMKAIASDANDMYVFYNDVLDTRTSMLISSNSGTTWSSFDNDGIYFNMSINIIVYDEYHVITAPGLYSLVGPKYIVIRCLEIEEHSFRSLAFTRHHMGLGLIKLGVVGYSDNRMDFNKVPLREFHPIGKLKRITLRFELPSGALYDFKGVNHNITFAIHYLEPIQKESFRASILNPNYDGNFVGYMYKQDEQEVESDDQEEDFNRDDLEDYRKQENLHVPENQWRRNLDFIHTLPEFRDLDYE